MVKQLMIQTCFLAGCIASGLHVHGQGTAYDFLLKIKEANSNAKTVYNYKISLKDITSNKTIDSMAGKFYRNGATYLDSNKSTISAYTNGYFFKLNHQRKQAVVYNVPLVKKKLGMTNAESDGLDDILILIDSSFFKNGKLDINTKPNGNYLVRMTQQNAQMIDAIFEIDRYTYKINYLSFETPDGYDENDKIGFKKVFTLYNVSQEVPVSVFNMTRYYILTSDSAILNKKYNDYKLISLIK